MEFALLSNITECLARRRGVVVPGLGLCPAELKPFRVFGQRYPDHTPFASRRRVCRVFGNWTNKFPRVQREQRTTGRKAQVNERKRDVARSRVKRQ